MQKFDKEHQDGSRPAADNLKLAYSQRALWFIYKMDAKNAAYNLSQFIRIEGKVDLKALESAVADLVARQPMLASLYKADAAGEPTRWVPATARVDYKVVTGSHAKDALRTAVYKDSLVPFDLEQGPSFRVRVYQRAEGGYLAHLCVHHINADGQSLFMMTDLVKNAYLRAAGVTDEVPEEASDFNDFVEWQQSFVASDEGNEQLEFWKKNLGGELPLLSLPADYPRPPVQTYNGTTLKNRLDRAQIQKIGELARANGTTLYNVLLAGYQILLNSYTGQDDIVIGTSFLGRGDDKFENVVGYFVNKLTIRGSVDADATVGEQVGKTSECVVSAMSNWEYPFPLVVEKLRIARDASRSPVFQTNFNFLRTHAGEEESEGGVSFASEFGMIDQAEGQFDVALEIVDTTSEITASFKYNKDLFSADTIDSMAKAYSAIVSQLASGFDQKISSLKLVTGDEEKRVLHTFNDTKASYDNNRTVIDLFEESVQKHGSRTAVVAHNGKLTYNQLNDRVNAVASHLLEAGVKGNEIVAVLAEPSVEMMAGILGILKAGCGYLPIDPGQPESRIEYLLQDSGARFVMRKTKENKKFNYGGQIVDIASVPAASAEGVKKVGATRAKPRDLVYLIYTSGTTGNPKGAMLEHRSLVNYCEFFRTRYGVSQDSCSALMTSYAFDLGYTTLWTTILYGGELHLLAEDVYTDTPALLSYMHTNKVNFIKLTPSLFNAIVNAPEFEKSNQCEVLKMIVTGGEKIRPDDIRAYFKKYPQVKIVNHYGPTETTIGIMTNPISTANLDAFAARPVIGKPIGNVRAYVVNKSMKALPVGVPGELIVAGPSLARGYLGREQMTAEKFVPNPFDPSEKVYRTGDLCRWTPEGTIEFLGRIDRQVKIRGYRVELGEIENQIRKIPGVTGVAVLEKSAGEFNKFLCAYYVSEKKMSAQELQEKLGKVMPEYMVPSYFVHLTELPTNANGKLDQGKLPEPNAEAPVADLGDGPSTDIEKKLVEMWAKYLGLGADKISTKKTFFELGGHSLLVIRMLGEIRAKFGCALPITAVYNGGTVKSLGELIATKTQDQNKAS